MAMRQTMHSVTMVVKCSMFVLQPIFLRSCCSLPTMPIATGETWDEQLNSLAHSIAGHYKTKPKAAPEYDKICRVILASMLPRAMDLPSDLIFCKR